MATESTDAYQPLTIMQRDVYTWIIVMRVPMCEMVQKTPSYAFASVII